MCVRPTCVKFFSTGTLVYAHTHCPSPHVSNIKTPHSVFGVSLLCDVFFVEPMTPNKLRNRVVWVYVCRASPALPSLDEADRSVELLGRLRRELGAWLVVSVPPKGVPGYRVRHFSRKDGGSLV